MNLYLLGNFGEAYRRYWKRTDCGWRAYWVLSHLFREKVPRREVKPGFARRKGWLGRVKKRDAGGNRLGYEDGQDET